MISYWRGLSVREKFLALLTVALLLGGVAYLVGYRALGTYQSLDQRIAQLEQEIINLAEQEAKSASAEVAFQSMAAEHSSAWTKEEILDRLRQEIYRLTLTDVDTPNPKAQDYMVRIGNLSPGELNTEAEGYREFKLAFNLDSAPIVNVLRFVERLQNSRQSLRVDTLDMRRSPNQIEASATIEITRTVLDNDPNRTVLAAIDQNLLANAGFEEWESDNIATEWSGAGCSILRSAERATEGSWCLQAAAEQDAGFVYQARKLAKGHVYRLSVDVSTDGPGIIGIGDEDSGTALDGAQPLLSDGQTYRYELVFTPPQSDRTPALQAPLITLEKAGTKVYLDNARLERVEERR